VVSLDDCSSRKAALLKEAIWGAKLRLFVGAGLSMVDLASDIVVVVVTYTNEGGGGERSLTTGDDQQRFENDKCKNHVGLDLRTTQCPV